MKINKNDFSKKKNMNTYLRWRTLLIVVVEKSVYHPDKTDECLSL